MIDLPATIKADYVLFNQEKFLEELPNQINFVVTLFRSIPKEEGWLSRGENQEFVSKCITKFEDLAHEGKLAAEDARRVYAAVVEGGLGNLFKTFTCRFPNNGDILLNRMLFNAISENSRQANFDKCLQWSGGNLGFKDSELSSILYFKEWSKTGKINFDKQVDKNLAQVIGDLLLFTMHQKVDDMSSELLTFVKSQLSLGEKVDVAFYIATKGQLETANTLLKNSCEGICLCISEWNSNSAKGAENHALQQLSEMQNEEEMESSIEILANSELNMLLSLAVDLEQVDSEIFESLFSGFGEKVRGFSVDFKAGDEKRLHRSVNGVIALLYEMKNLEHLHIRAKEVNLQADQYKEIGEKCPNVSSIALDECKQVHHEFVNELLERLGPKLKHLRLNGCGDINDTVAETISTYCREIETFFFDSGDVENESDISNGAVIDMFGHCEQLRTLQFLNSVNAPAPPGEKKDKPYDIGVVNLLNKLYPKRPTNVDYDFLRL